MCQGFSRSVDTRVHSGLKVGVHVARRSLRLVVEESIPVDVGRQQCLSRLLSKTYRLRRTARTVRLRSSVMYVQVIDLFIYLWGLFESLSHDIRRTLVVNISKILLSPAQ